MSNPDPSKLHARCPVCGFELWAQRSGEWTLKSTMLKLGPAGLEARCPQQGCRGLVRLEFLQIVQPPQRVQKRRVMVRSRLPSLDKAGRSGTR